MPAEEVGEASGPPARIGIFGGTFDPVHVGHVESAATVRRTLGLDRVLLVVANDPWQKQGTRQLTPAEDRYAMVAAAAEGRTGLEPSRIEIERGGPSYTVDTVREIHRLDPSSRLFVVIGADLVAQLPTWRDVSRLQREVTLAVVCRPGTTPLASTEPPSGWRSVTVPVVPFDVSSTDLRSRLESGSSVEGMVPEAVIRCIQSRGLYAGGR
ncbi:MAG: nicotinate-nucleotide adenylyltransferase [Acidimicrobiales bacterium]